MSDFVFVLLNTLLYVVVGIVFFVISIILVEKSTKWSLRKEILEDENVALGIMFAAIFLGIAIIIAAAIHG